MPTQSPLPTHLPPHICPQPTTPLLPLVLLTSVPLTSVPAEKTSASGVPVVIRSEVYVNSVRCHVPYALCDFNAAEVELLRRTGPYTKPWANICSALEWGKVQQELRSFQMEYHTLLEEAIASASQPRHEVPLVTIMRTLLGYPQVDNGGPTAMQFLQVLEKCDTKSYEDLRRIFKHGWENSGLEDPLFFILFGDGQTVLRACAVHVCCTVMHLSTQPLLTQVDVTACACSHSTTRAWSSESGLFMRMRTTTS